MPALVLDSTALSVLAHGDDPARRDRVRAAMAEAAAAGFVVRVPTVVLAELCRSTALRTQVEQTMARFGLQTANLGAVTAKHVGRMLGRDGLDSCALADAAVVATAIHHGGGVVATGDPDDLGALAADNHNVRVLAL
jgi:predicted nucleic acid-binding protein